MIEFGGAVETVVRVKKLLCRGDVRAPSAKQRCGELDFLWKRFLILSFVNFAFELPDHDVLEPDPIWSNLN